MKKTKKLFACLLAAATTFAMGATAFAAGTQQPVEGKVHFISEYKLEGAGTSPAETFQFTIENEGVTDAADGVTTANMPTPTLGTAAYSAGDASTEGNKKNVEVTLPTYTSVGVYTYNISQTAGTTAGVTYDAVPVVMKVTVLNQDGGVGVSTVSFTKNGTKLDDAAAFTNIYTANTLSVKKTVSGDLGDKSKYFDFEVTLTGQDGKQYGASYAVTGGSNGSNPATVTIGTPATFKLKHDETITIANLPAGITYKVEEVNVDARYTTTVNGASSKVAQGTTSATAVNANYENSYGATVDTGVNLTNLPYILVFLGVLFIAGIALVSRKRRFDA